MATFSHELETMLSILTVLLHADMLAPHFPHSVRSRIILTGSLRSTMRLGKRSLSSLICLNMTIMRQLDAFGYHHCSHLIRTQMALFSTSLKRCQVIFIMSLHSGPCHHTVWMKTDRTTGVRCCVIDRNSCLAIFIHPAPPHLHFVCLPHSLKAAKALWGSAVWWYPASIWDVYSVEINTSLLEAWTSISGTVTTGHNPTFHLLGSQEEAVSESVSAWMGD